ncbi:MAG: BamA/TamA family outer membrane protein [Bacteroidales bacterium]|nr:BamA/TamA family outer membrane protein [Bacteroidales bacterium]
MKKIILLATAFMLVCSSAFANPLAKKDTTATKKKEKSTVKTGLNFGPLPALGFDGDKGFQYGAILQIFDYGDGSSYPNYNSKSHIEYSRFTKGSQLIQLRHDNRTLIPGVRWSTAVRINLDKAFDFFGFNGYQSYYDYQRIADGKAKIDYGFSPFYKMSCNEYKLTSDFTGSILPNFYWEAGIFVKYMQIASVDIDNINKGKKEGDLYPKDQTTLFDIYKKTGVISAEEANGGFASGFRFGLCYDSRDKESAPSRGIWAEAHVTLAPSFISKIQYYRYSLTFRHYVRIIPDDVLTFAYRLNYEGNFGNNAPFYALPYLTTMGESVERDGMGGYGTVRGVMRNRDYGLDMGSYIAEFRWRFVKFMGLKQNMAFALNIFSDGSIVTRGRDITPLYSVTDSPVPIVNKERKTDSFHITFGAGLRFIMNENFIIAVEYGLPVSMFTKRSPLYKQDGTGALYVNVGYAF